VRGRILRLSVLLGIGMVTAMMHSTAFAAENGPPAAKSDQAEAYYPPSESGGGWRRINSDEDVRKLAGFDPELLDYVGAYQREVYGGPWVIVVIRHGYLVREWYGVPAMPQTTFDVWSATKSATGTAFGMLFEDSRNHKLPHDAQIDLDSLAYPYIPEAYPLTDERKAKITLRHLLSMTSGIRGESSGMVGLAIAPGGGEYEIALGKEKNRLGASAAKLFANPGDAWEYSDAAFSQLSLVFSKVAGQEIGEYMKTRLFLPIGIENSGWDWEGGGGHIGPHTNDHSGLRLTGRDFARFGYLMARGGVWKGQQIVPKWWIELATKSSQQLNPSYGYSYWVNTPGDLWKGVPKDAYAFMGHASTRCYIVPSLDLVVVRLGYAPPVWSEGELLGPIVSAIVE
jgi:CubicO group peptidase (beta-lactamase class C family)